MIKTFRGLLPDGAQDHVRLQTIKGKVGYRVVKFQIMTEKVSTASVEHTLQIFKVEQDSVSATVDFSDSDLLGVAVVMSRSDAYNAPIQQDVIFDNEIFNQDIFITHIDNLSSQACNYYLELEVIPLTDHDAEFTTLKDIRGRNTT